MWQLEKLKLKVNPNSFAHMNVEPNFVFEEDSFIKFDKDTWHGHFEMGKRYVLKPHEIKYFARNVNYSINSELFNKTFVIY